MSRAPKTVRELKKLYGPDTREFVRAYSKELYERAEYHRQHMRKRQVMLRGERSYGDAD